MVLFQEGHEKRELKRGKQIVFIILFRQKKAFDIALSVNFRGPL